MFKVGIQNEDWGTADVPLKVWKFPCGEVGVKAEDYISVSKGSIGLIRWQFQGSDDFLILSQIVDILRYIGLKEIRLEVPYFPYARQDRRCFDGESHALKVAASFINALDFESVLTYDAHSTVTEAVVDRLYNIPQEVCASELPIFDMLIAPDAGAEKKIFKHRQVVTYKVPVITAGKHRDETGKIVGVNVPNPWQVADLSVCVVDDLCDGGATFIELGKVLKKESPAKLNLYVTHGMFTKGLDALFEIYDDIYAYNVPNLAFHERVRVLSNLNK